MANSIFITPFGGTIQGDVIVTGQGLFADGTAAAPSISFQSAPTVGVYRLDSSGIGVSSGGTAVVYVGASALNVTSTTALSWTNSATNPNTTLDLTIARAAAGSIQFKNSTAVATLTVPTGATNVVPVVASDPATRKVGATNAQTIGSFTVGAADATFRVSANILVTTATSHSFTVTCAYTDEGNTGRTLTLNFSTLAGVISNTAIGNAGGAVPYNGVVQHIRCKAATTITIATTGTFTTVTYNGEGIIEKVT